MASTDIDPISANYRRGGSEGTSSMCRAQAPSVSVAMIVRHDRGRPPASGATHGALLRRVSQAEASRRAAPDHSVRAPHVGRHIARHSRAHIEPDTHTCFALARGAATYVEVRWLVFGTLVCVAGVARCQGAARSQVGAMQPGRTELCSAIRAARRSGAAADRRIAGCPSGSGFGAAPQIIPSCRGKSRACGRTTLSRQCSDEGRARPRRARRASLTRESRVRAAKPEGRAGAGQPQAPTAAFRGGRHKAWVHGGRVRAAQDESAEASRCASAEAEE